jgi:enoyl-CoA hydratase/carnithine racemase
MKALTRIPIFSYNTIATTLITDSKSLEIKFRNKYLSIESLFEFESIISWCATHSEVQTITITVYGDYFLQGIDPAELKEMSEDKLKKIINKVSTIAQSIYCLPQTVIMDLKKSAVGFGLELALAADIRVCDPKATFCFNQLNYGLIPSVGTFSFLYAYLNKNILRSLVLSSREFGVETMNLLGGYCEITSSATELIKHIFTQAPIARMQAKRGFVGEVFNQSLTEKIEVEKGLFNVTVATEDYKIKEPFIGLKEFKEKMSETTTN